MWQEVFQSFWRSLTEVSPPIFWASLVLLIGLLVAKWAVPGRLLRQTERVLIFGLKHGGLFFPPLALSGDDFPIPLFDLWNKQIKMISTYAGVEKDIVEAIELIRSKKIIVTDMITHKLPMKDTPKGFKLTDEAKESMKIIIEPQK